MKIFDSLDAIINAIIDEIEAQGATVRITGGSAQSCSTYLDVNDLAVRISDHAPRMQMSVVDYHIGLGSLHGDDSIDVQSVYEQMVLDVDEIGEVVSSEYVECEEYDEDAELVGYRVSTSEIKRIAAAAIAAAKKRNERMKHHKQMRTGSVTGAGKKYRGKPTPALASIPRNLPPIRQARRNKQAPFVLPVGMSNLLIGMFKGRIVDAVLTNWR